MRTKTNRKRWIISDPHFYHQKIIDYESRPWKTAVEMNKALVKNWNDTVSKDDLVYCLGDVSFSNKEKTEEIVRQLNGEIHLVLGNHDRGRSLQWYRDIGFSFVSPHPLLIDDFVILSHEPVYMNQNMPYVNIHGHTHSQNHGDSSLYFNASVEMIEYRPILLDVIYNYFKSHDHE